MKIKTILVIEDEKKILDVIQAYLKKEGFDVLAAQDGETAIEMVQAKQVHLIILDLMLPKISGEDVCRKIRTMSDIPIIMLTARAEEDDKIEGLAIGADDYMTKPFSPRELISRVRALIRRSYRDEQPLADFLSYNHGDLEVDVKRMLVKKNGDILNFTPNEFKLLYVFLVNPGQIFTREQLIEKAFGYDYDGFDRTIDTHIKNIRQKIENDPKSPVYILTVYGMGYKFGGGK